MSKIPNELRETIAWNIRACRMEKFPGRGGCKNCAESFGVSPQQWSPWERGYRTPDEGRLVQIAEFFGKTVEYMRRDNRPGNTASRPEKEPTASHGQFSDSDWWRRWQNAAMNTGTPSVAPPGSPESFFLLFRYLVDYLVTNGIRVRMDQAPHARDSCGLPPPNQTGK
jgi:transcriptional regulator with XRE-family HTH domain